MAELDEQGKLFKAFKVKANRDSFRSAKPSVPDVDLDQISEVLKARLRQCDDGELIILADVNQINLTAGHAFPGHGGIGAV